MPVTKEKEKEIKPLTVKIELTAMEKENKQLAAGRKTSYEVKVKEQADVHVELEKVNMNSSTFKKESKPFVQIFDLRAWDNFRKQALKLGFNHVRVLYAPKGTNLEVVDPVKQETKEK